MLFNTVNVGVSPMHVRYLKIMFATITSLMALIYVTQNMVNADAAHQVIIYVMGGADHTVYENSFGPKFSHLTLGWVVIVIIFSLEYAAGLLMAKGAWDMWQARNAELAAFAVSKKWALIGSGVGVFVWFGLFGVIGAAFFQMWQTEIGAGSMDDAFQFFVSCAITLLFLNQPDQ
jgi:predicted small integral membrane protein